MRSARFCFESDKKIENLIFFSTVFFLLSEINQALSVGVYILGLD